MDDPKYLWIARWETFQHYKPDPERGPKWIKTHTAQLADSRYLDLTDRQRALLHDLRMMFATFRGRLTRDAAMIARHRSRQTRDADLVLLNHAGLVEFISRATLEQRLEELYSRSRAEVEVEKNRTTRAVPPTRDAAHAPLPESPTSSNGKALGFHQQQIDQSLAEAKRGDT